MMSRTLSSTLLVLLLLPAWATHAVAQQNRNTTIQNGQVNINHTVQCGDTNDNATLQEGRVNINRTVQGLCRGGTEAQGRGLSMRDRERTAAHIRAQSRAAVASKLQR